jgi:hypothetical protein
MTIETRAESLLSLVESDRDRRREAILAGARKSASLLLAEAHRKAQARMRAAFLDERRQNAERLHAARAHLQTRRRAAAQERAGALLAAAWQRFPAALHARWRDPMQRAAWIAHMLTLARRVLPARAWRIDHAAGWPESEQQASATTLREAGIDVQFTCSAGIDAGMLIRADSTVIDGTVEGLLADHAEIGARLLFALEARA